MFWNGDNKVKKIKKERTRQAHWKAWAPARGRTVKKIKWKKDTQILVDYA